MRTKTSSTDSNTPSIAVLLYQGIDSVSQTPRDGRGTGSAPETVNGSVDAHCNVTSTFEQFNLTFGLSAKATVRSPGVKVTAKAQFAQSIALTEYSTCYIVQSEVSNTSIGTNYELPPKIQTELDSTIGMTANDFVHKMGDSYVSQITKGACYYGVFVFHCTSRSQHTSVSASLSAKSLNTSGSLSTSLQQIKDKSSVEVTIHQTVLGYSAAQLPTCTGLESADAMLVYAQQFNAAAILSTDKTVLAFETLGYEGAVEFPSESYFQKVTTNRQKFLPNVPSDDSATQGWMENLGDIEFALRSAESINSFYVTFGRYLDARLQSAQVTLQSTRNAINGNIGTWINDATATLPAIDVSCVKWGAPTLNYKAISYPIFGQELTNKKITPTLFGGCDPNDPVAVDHCVDGLIGTYATFSSLGFRFAGCTKYDDYLTGMRWTTDRKTWDSTDGFQAAEPGDYLYGASSSTNCAEHKFDTGDSLLSVLLARYPDKPNIGTVYFAILDATGDKNQWYGFGGFNSNPFIQWWSDNSNDYVVWNDPTATPTKTNVLESTPAGTNPYLLSFCGYYYTEGKDGDVTNIFQLAAVGFYFQEAGWTGDPPTIAGKLDRGTALDPHPNREPGTSYGKVTKAVAMEGKHGQTLPSPAIGSIEQNRSHPLSHS